MTPNEVRLLATTLWCVVALGTLVSALRVWWPIHKAARAARHDADQRLAVWSAANARVMGGLALVAMCNLAAGLLAASVGPRSNATWPPAGREDYVAILIPLLFVFSGVVKLVVTAGVWSAYARVTRPEELEESPS